MYRLEFVLEGLPKMSNQLLGQHWTIRQTHSKKWKAMVFLACWELRPKAPLRKAKITLIRCASREPDFDGLASGFKPILDGLVEAGIIIDDKPSIIGQPTYLYEKAKQKAGCVKIIVEEA